MGKGVNCKKTSSCQMSVDRSEPTSSRMIQDGYYTEWIANVHVNVEALDGSFGIYFFFGEPPADEAEWELAPNQAGSVGIFAMNRMTGSQSRYLARCL